MARLPRIVVAGQPMHIMHRGNNHQDIFKNEDDYFRFLNDLKDCLKQYDCDLHAYVLMTNHFHLLLTPHSEKALSSFMQALGRRYVQYFNKMYQRSGTLWEGRFKSSLIDSERYLMTCYRYIEMNPVRANMVEGAEDYRWSSFHRNALGVEDSLITEHFLYTQLASDQAGRLAAYKGLFDSGLTRQVIDLLGSCIQKDEAVGCSAYHIKLSEQLGRSTKRGQHGGDRKSCGFLDNNEK